MEHNHINLKKAIARFPQYEPGEEVWDSISENLNAAPLRAALHHLPEYEPDEQLWGLIERKAVKPKTFKWWYAAAITVFALGAGLLLWLKKNSPVIYTQELADTRLQPEPNAKTDQQFKLLAAYCETEMLVCNSTEYRNLKEEYQKLSSASEQLQHAIGTYNSEPELLRQYNEIERQKTDILNEMAKMI